MRLAAAQVAGYNGAACWYPSADLVPAPAILPIAGWAVTAALVGLRVRRGPGWTFGDEDGGSGGLGTIAEPTNVQGWCSVLWDNGRRKDYHIGQMPGGDSAAVLVFADWWEGRPCQGSRVLPHPRVLRPQGAAGSAPRPGELGTVMRVTGDTVQVRRCWRFYSC